MDSVKGAALCLIAIGALGVGYAQTTIPRDKIPANIPAEVREQIEALYSDNRDKAIEAAVNLGEMGEKAAPAVPFLMDLVGVPSSGISSYPRELALRFVPDDVFVLDSGDKIGVEGAKSLSAAVALAKIGKPALQPLLAALQSPSPDVVYGAVRALALMKDAVATEALVKAIKDENLKGRADAVREIGRTRDPRVVDALIDLLKNKDPELRSGAVLGLGKAKDTRAMGHMIAALQDEDANVRGNALAALEQMTGQELGYSPKAWEEWWKKKQAN